MAVDTRYTGSGRDGEVGTFVALQGCEFSGVLFPLLFAQAAAHQPQSATWTQGNAQFLPEIRRCCHWMGVAPKVLLVCHQLASQVLACFPCFSISVSFLVQRRVTPEFGARAVFRSVLGTCQTYSH